LALDFGIFHLSKKKKKNGEAKRKRRFRANVK